MTDLNLLKQKSGAMRESGIELLRIILMFQVVFLHICDYGKYSTNVQAIGGVQTLLYWLMMLCSRTPVYVYIVILGYFSVSSKSNQNFRDILPKVKKMYLPMIFYSLLIPVVLWCAGVTDFSLTNLVKAFLPVLSRTWSFMSLYLVVILLSPFINKCINNISKRDFMILLGILFAILSVWNMLGNLDPIDNVISVKKVVNTEGGKSLYGYLFMYLIGAFVKLHVKKYDKAKWRFLVAFFALAALNTVLVYVVKHYTSVVFYNDNPISVIQGVCLLLFFRDLKFKSRIVNHIALLNLGIYMIHEHPMIRDFIWNDLFSFTQDSSFYSSFPQYIFVALGICAVVFIVCAMLEQLRRWLFALPGILRRKNPTQN